MKSKRLFSERMCFLLVSLLSIFSLASCGLFSSTEEGQPSTATDIKVLQSNSDAYVNEEFGISITIPDGIEATTAEEGSDYLQEYMMGDSEGFGILYPVTMASGETLQQIAQSVFASESSWLDDIEVLQDEEIALKQGGSAWHTRFTGYDIENEYTLEIRLTTILHAQRALVLEMYSLPEYFSSWESRLKQMQDSIELFSPMVEGLPRDQVLILEGGESSNPRENDPATMHSSGDYLIFEGLVTYNEKLEIVPALAAGWEVSEGGTVYTFTLQPDALFHDGKPVTAADVVYSWERAADPETDSEMAMTYLGDIVGVKEMHDGEADHISGLTILDDHTLQVSIDAPKAYFLHKLTFPTANVLDRENVETGEEWYKNPNGTGPYRLTRWDSMERKVYERFEDYYGELPSIKMVLYTLYTGDEFRLYEEGAVDIAGVSDYNADRVNDPSEPLNKELVTGISLCTSYVQFDVTQPPFDDVKVRQAFTMAFDKEKYLEVVLKGTDMIAKGLYPPAMPGYNLDLQGYDYDPELARQLIAESSYGSVEAFPEIVFTSSGYGSYSNSLVAAMSQMWQQNLGVTISVQNLDPEKMLDEDVTEEYGQLTTTGWCADYPDPENFADVLFHTGAGMNDGGYSNPQFDELVEQARIEPDVENRMALYQQAEEILVDDAAAIFLFHFRDNVVVKPYVKGYILSPVSTYPLIRYLSIDPTYWE